MLESRLNTVWIRRCATVRRMYGIFDRGITKYTVMYGVCVCIFTVLANPMHILSGSLRKVRHTVSA